MTTKKTQKKQAQYPLRINADLKNRAQHYALDNQLTLRQLIELAIERFLDQKK